MTILHAIIAGALTLLATDQAPQDYTKTKLSDLGVKEVAPAKDPKTGFLVGGANATALIKKLTEINGQKIADLEKAMRPGQLSKKGFLGKDERLLDVLAADNKLVVEQLGLTHQQLALHLNVLAAIGKREKNEFTYHGRRFKVTLVAYRGIQDSPFDDGTRSNTNATATNLDTGKTLTFSLLVPMMVERYGFYEGKGTPYRVDPRKVIEVLDFLQPKVKTKE
jgi:hypothetical protein